MSSASLIKTHILKKYDIGQLTHLKKLDLGQVNTSYALETVKNGEHHTYLLRKYKRGIRKPEIEFEHSIIRHLTNKNFLLVPRLIRTRDGGSYVEAGEAGQNDSQKKRRFYAVFEYFPGRDKYDWDNPACSDTELISAAAAQAQYHQAVSDLVPAGKRYDPKIIDFLPIAAAKLKKLAAKKIETEFGTTARKHLTAIIKYVETTYRRIESFESDEIIYLAIHGDYHPGNLKLKNGRVIGMFDFDWSKIDARCFDVALAIIYFCSTWDGDENGDLRLDKAAKFLCSYQTTLDNDHLLGPLTKSELTLLPHMLKAANIYVLNWIFEDYDCKGVDADTYLVYLHHNVRLMQWLENAANLKAVENITSVKKTRNFA